jgi:hypothetical protein
MNRISLTVDTPATSYDLTTLAVAKEELDISDSQYDGMLQRWISETSILLAGSCNRVFGLETVTEVFSGLGSLMLSRYPVTNLISIVDSGSTDQMAYFVLNPTTGVLRRAGLPNDWMDRNLDHMADWTCWYQLTVQYTAGYSLPGSVPLPLQQACLTLLKHRWSARTRDPSLRAIDIPGVVSKTFWVSNNADGLPPEVQQLLDPYMDRGL